MKRFRCTVTRTDEYIIELDEKILNQEWMDNFKKWFYNIGTLEEHADHIAQFRARFGERFIEGYGNPMVNGENPFMVKDDEVNRGINIRVLSEDNDIDVHVKEI